MRDSLKSKAGWLWVLAFLALPKCALQRGGLGGGIGTTFNPGEQPFSSAIFCDIENKDAAPHCASATEVSMGIPLTRAAVALVRTESGNIGLDFSPAATAALSCSPGQPVAVTFRGPFPDGASVCLNCAGVIGPVYADVNAACVARCKDLNGAGSDAFCEASGHAHASTNASACVAGACTNEGALRGDFVDPRRTPEPVIWTNAVGVGVSGPDSNTLTRTAPTSVSFDAGAASSQTITGGDGYVEFTATETDQARVCGLASGAGPDNDVTLADIDFGIRLGVAGNVNISESGTAVPGPDINGGFGTYATGDRLRVSVADNFDGTANVTYSLIPAACAGAGCDGMVLRTVGGANYPFRVDASMRTQGGTLTDVRVVRIK